MKTYFDVYLPIANILIESSHQYSKKVSGRDKKDSNKIYRKRKSGERMHITNDSVHHTSVPEYSGRLPFKAMRLPGSKKQIIQQQSKTHDDTLGKGSKAQRRIKALKTKKGE